MKYGREYVVNAGPRWAGSKSRIAYRCASEAAVSEKTARGVLFLGWPITSNARERAFRWGVENRIPMGQRQTPATKPDAAETKPAPAPPTTEAPDAGALEQGLRTILEIAKEHPELFATGEGAENPALQAVRAEIERRRKSDEAARAFDEIVAAARAKEATTAESEVE